MKYSQWIVMHNKVLPLLMKLTILKTYIIIIIGFMKCFPFAEQCEKHIIPDFIKKSSQVAPQDNGSSSGPTNSKWPIKTLVPQDISLLTPYKPQ